MNLRLPLGALLCFSACFDQCLEGGSGGTGGGEEQPSFDAEYDLVEATGEWSITGTSTTSSCVSSTTAGKTSFTLTTPQERAAEFTARSGYFTANAQVPLVLVPGTGTATCNAMQRSCPSNPGTPQDVPGFFLITAGEPGPTSLGELGEDPPDGLAFFPTLSEPILPRLCDGTSYDAPRVFRRGRPITVAQLKSGRFVVEASGTAPLGPKAGAPGDAVTPVTGTLTYTFRFVYQTKDYDPSKAVEAPQLPSFDECLTTPATSIDALDDAALAYADGGTELPLDALGCRRITVARAGGGETLTHELTAGTKLVYDATTGTTRAERDLFTLYRRVDDATGLRETFDSNADGFDEESVDSVYSGGTWQSTTAKYFDQGMTTPHRTVTVTRVDATTMQVRVEAAGRVEDEFVTSIEERACFDSTSMTDPACRPAATGPCTGGKMKCTPMQKRDMRTALKDALAKGNECMTKAGYDGFQPSGKGLTLLATDKLNLICSNNPCDDFGSFKSEKNADGTHDFMINLARGTGVGLQSTLFHEMLHSDPSFKHNDPMVEMSAKACKLHLADRTYACEAMCFAPKVGGACACERCLNPSKSEPKKEICDKCKDFGACPGRPGVRSDGKMGEMSQGIAAWCDRQKILCDTKAECDSACTVGGGCQQIKTVCDDTCN
ncbi:MAG: hypothetical protein JNK82_05955 [Myxococcaceae bacterium]|nr:hypothetical protein [Myxococcaceae bacterium]